MKNLIAVLFCLVSTSALAETLSWGDLEAGPKYILNADIPFENGMVLKKGDAFALDDMGQGNAPVVYLTFKNLSCTDPSLTAEMVLFNPEPNDTAHDKSIGVEMYEDCYVSMYVEPQFFYNISVFDDK